MSAVAESMTEHLGVAVRSVGDAKTKLQPGLERPTIPRTRTAVPASAQAITAIGAVMLRAASMRARSA